MKIGTSLKVLGTVVLAGAFASNAMAAGYELKLGHNGKPGSLFEACANEFAKIANAKLGDKGKVTVFGAGQLGKDKEMLKKIKLGTAHLALNSSIMASKVDEIGMFDMPYLVKDRAHMAKIEKEIFWPKLAPAAEKKGYKILALWENGFRHITNNARPINVPADLKGIKLRTPSSVWRVKMFKSYGANPSPLPFGEVFVALKTGTFDGQENPFAQIASARFQEVQKYLSLTGHVYTPGYIVADAKKWKKVPADVAAIVEQAAKDTQPFVYKYAAELEKKLLKELKDGGITVNSADKQAFIDASAPIYEEFGKSVAGGSDLVNKAIALGK
ncbi:MAG: TRAP transporter substrate-binding protein [Rhodospirillales bacterium]|jgi:TRAP-type transport system periplasmic protein|nr:TRAP transporter substrate-binding protein [Rhodospirillales bacterium]